MLLPKLTHRSKYGLSDKEDANSHQDKFQIKLDSFETSFDFGVMQMLDVGVELDPRKIQGIANYHVEVERYLEENILQKVGSKTHILKPEQHARAQQNSHYMLNNQERAHLHAQLIMQAVTVVRVKKSFLTC